MKKKTKMIDLTDQDFEQFIKKENNFDVAVVGAGPAGMIAAGRAAELGARVILIEKNKKSGKKLLLTGKGRCNITNAEFNLRKLVENYGKNGKFLFHAFSVFGPKDVIDFFEKLGLKTKIERGKRVFPFSDKSEDVLKVLIEYLIKNKVNIIYNSEVIRIDYQNRKIKKLILKNREIVAENYIFCTGGKSYSLTGSTGDGFKWSNDLGHHSKELSPALVPIKTKENWVRELQGLSLKNVEIRVFQKDKKERSEFGECLFTHFGLSGPIILDISKKVGELLKNGEVKLLLDLKPALDFAKLDKRVQRDFKKYQNKSFKNCLTDLLPCKLIPVIVKLSNIDSEKKVNNITREERQNLVKLLKNLEMTAEGLLGFDSA
ncbi:aminoacetone oxidase family FAD-binding enzyme, partial [Patescibacteria group bacterium]|nr:aminoacetone oxidase family FAD-binding enzyme [Patescibacteria group bacterium]